MGAFALVGVGMFFATSGGGGEVEEGGFAQDATKSDAYKGDGDERALKTQVANAKFSDHPFSGKPPANMAGNQMWSFLNSDRVQYSYVENERKGSTLQQGFCPPCYRYDTERKGGKGVCTHVDAVPENSSVYPGVVVDFGAEGGIGDISVQEDLTGMGASVDAFMKSQELEKGYTGCTAEKAEATWSAEMNRVYGEEALEGAPAHLGRGPAAHEQKMGQWGDFANRLYDVSGLSDTPDFLKNVSYQSALPASCAECYTQDSAEEDTCVHMDVVDNVAGVTRDGPGSTISKSAVDAYRRENADKAGSPDAAVSAWRWATKSWTKGAELPQYASCTPDQRVRSAGEEFANAVEKQWRDNPRYDSMAGLPWEEGDLAYAARKLEEEAGGDFCLPCYSKGPMGEGGTPGGKCAHVNLDQAALGGAMDSVGGMGLTGGKDMFVYGGTGKLDNQFKPGAGPYVGCPPDQAESSMVEEHTRNNWNTYRYLPPAGTSYAGLGAELKQLHCPPCYYQELQKDSESDQEYALRVLKGEVQCAHFRDPADLVPMNRGPGGLSGEQFVDMYPEYHGCSAEGAADTRQHNDDSRVKTVGVLTGLMNAENDRRKAAAAAAMTARDFPSGNRFMRVGADASGNNFDYEDIDALTGAAKNHNVCPPCYEQKQVDGAAACVHMDNRRLEKEVAVTSYDHISDPLTMDIDASGNVVSTSAAATDVEVPFDMQKHGEVDLWFLKNNGNWPAMLSATQWRGCSYPEYEEAAGQARTAVGIQNKYAWRWPENMTLDKMVQAGKQRSYCPPGYELKPGDEGNCQYAYTPDSGEPDLSRHHGDQFTTSPESDTAYKNSMASGKFSGVPASFMDNNELGDNECVADHTCKTTYEDPDVCHKPGAPEPNSCARCTQNSDCVNPWTTAEFTNAVNRQGQCLPDNTCADCTEDSHCANGTKCTNGKCLQCTSDAQCGGTTPNCDTSTFTCQACVTDSQCATRYGSGSGDKRLCADVPGGGRACVACNQNAHCPSDKPVCVGKDTPTAFCGECGADSDCPTGQACSDTKTCVTTCAPGEKYFNGQCVECTHDGECPSGGCDQNNKCVDCQSGTVWNSSQNKCVQCNSSSDCSVGANGVKPMCMNNSCVECGKDASGGEMMTECKALGVREGGSEYTYNSCTNNKCSKCSECYGDYEYCDPEVGCVPGCDSHNDCKNQPNKGCNFQTNECTVECRGDADCADQNKGCNLSTGKCDLECTNDDHCYGNWKGGKCNTSINKCAQCNQNSDCYSGACAGGKCVDCTTDQQCMDKKNGTSQCLSYVCRQCGNDRSYDPGCMANFDDLQHCAGTRCVACAEDSHCPGNESCVYGECKDAINARETTWSNLYETKTNGGYQDHPFYRKPPRGLSWKDLYDKVSRSAADECLPCYIKGTDGKCWHAHGHSVSLRGTMRRKDNHALGNQEVLVYMNYKIGNESYDPAALKTLATTPEAMFNWGYGNAKFTGCDVYSDFKPGVPQTVDKKWEFVQGSYSPGFPYPYPTHVHDNNRKWDWRDGTTTIKSANPNNGFPTGWWY